MSPNPPSASFSSVTLNYDARVDNASNAAKTANVDFFIMSLFSLLYASIENFAITGNIYTKNVCKKDAQSLAEHSHSFTKLILSYKKLI